MFPQKFFLGANAPWTFLPLNTCPQGTEGKDIICAMSFPILGSKGPIIVPPQKMLLNFSQL
jgi:hypothetical protein